MFLSIRRDLSDTPPCQNMAQGRFMVGRCLRIERSVAGAKNSWSRQHSLNGMTLVPSYKLSPASRQRPRRDTPTPRGQGFIVRKQPPGRNARRSARRRSHGLSIWMLVGRKDLYSSTHSSRTILALVLWGLYVILVISVDVRPYFTGIALWIIPTTNTTQNFTIA